LGGENRNDVRRAIGEEYREGWPASSEAEAEETCRRLQLRSVGDEMPKTAVVVHPD